MTHGEISWPLLGLALLATYMTYRSALRAPVDGSRTKAALHFAGGAFVGGGGGGLLWLGFTSMSSMSWDALLAFSTVLGCWIAFAAARRGLDTLDDGPA